MKKLFTFASILLAGLFILSCGNKDNEGGGGSNLPQLGVSVNNAQAVYEVPKGETAALELVVTAEPTSPEAYTITLAANPSLVTAYNVKHGTSYASLPADAFSFPANQVILVRFTAKSSAATLRIGGGSCELGVTYLLPVVIDGVQGGTNFEAPDDKAAYILFKTLPPSMEGSGTAADPYIVASAEDLAKINNVLEENKTKYFKQTADIDFTGVITETNPWVPINPSLAKEGDETDPAQLRKLVYDGNNKKISNFNGGGAIFAVLSGSVKDLTIENANVTCTKKNVGGILAGTVGTTESVNEVVLKNIHIVGATLNNDYNRTGPLAAYVIGGIVEDCSATSTIQSNARTGGLIGRMDGGVINNCSAECDIKVAGYMGGGLVGEASNINVTDCRAKGNVLEELASSSYSHLGGLVGQLGGKCVFEKSYSSVNVTGLAHMAGGLVGDIQQEGSNVTFSQCFATGNVTLPHDPSTGNQAHAGGLLGSLQALNSTLTISNCYATGNITVRRYSSGFIGTTYGGGGKSKITVTNSYTTSDLSGIVLQDRCGLFFGQSGKYEEKDEGGNVIATYYADIKCSGFVAWNTGGWAFSYQDVVPVDGNYCGNEGTVSQQATALGWDTSIWDLSGNLPTLKNLIYE